MKKESIITIPNIITLVRLVLLPFFIFYLVNDKIDIAVLLFAIIAVSDMLDGLSARAMHQKTRIGSLFDSTTDWLVFISALVTALIIKKYISAEMIIIILVPTVIISIVKGAYVKKGSEADHTIIGKITVATAYISIIALLVDFTYKNVFLIALIVMTYATMVRYIVKYVKLLRR
jgi:phosphatidylglycerophosphate synthase|tara:strand:- start:180 stop:704 length:525 start_codon:yes stop_codon:yes gene_type:complete